MVSNPQSTKFKPLFGLGVVQVILGCLLFILNVIAYITWDAIIVYSAAGIWVGIMVSTICNSLSVNPKITLLDPIVCLPLIIKYHIETDSVDIICPQIY